MSDTTHLQLPCLEAAQAQKHVTVNEALRRLDALVHLAVRNRTLAAPPAAPAAGDRHIVAPGASGLWAGREGCIAAWTDGAWMFAAPGTGWRAWIESEGRFVLHDGTGWREGPAESCAAMSAHGAATHLRVIEGDHTIAAGASNDTALAIPDRAIVLGVTGLVLEAVGGASAWHLGVAADAQRYGNGIGAAKDSTVIGVSGTPVAYYGATPLRVTAAGGNFTGGRLRLAIHCLALATPGALSS